MKHNSNQTSNNFKVSEETGLLVEAGDALIKMYSKIYSALLIHYKEDDVLEMLKEKINDSYYSLEKAIYDLMVSTIQYNRALSNNDKI